jgi:hypothetical protein
LICPVSVILPVLDTFVSSINYRRFITLELYSVVK